MMVELESIQLSRSVVKTILVEGIRGKSLGRILMNNILSEFELSGNILDLGSGSDSASYNRFLKYKEPCNVTYSDMYREGENLVRIDMEKPFQIEHNIFDYVMCFNALEHVYNFRNVIEQSYRVLRRGGVFIGSTPFIHRFHPDPFDYFRYSHQALLRMFEEENFICERIFYIGFGPFTLAGTQWTSLMRKAFRRIFVFFDLFNILLDWIFSRISKEYPKTYALGYVFVFKKSL
ncbi:MAG: class I SAM-dependent methyltransferase [Chloroflexi bacterium]|nr:class I SAM-dependent methyltransferase [Chloroflexota bacterium]